MVAENYACAYKEVIEVLKYTKRKDYDFKIDTSKTLEEQNLSDEAKAIIANIFKKYWATDYQKERIEAKEKYDMEQLEKEKHEKYNPDDIFKRRQTNMQTESISDNVSIVEYKIPVFKRLMDKIKGLFIK